MTDLDRDGLTYDEVDLVLRRATELQHGAGHHAEGRISAEELERLAAEIGLSREVVRTALVHVRSTALAVPDGTATLSDRWFGPRRSVLTRTVAGPIEEVAALVDDYMRKQLFRVKRNFGDRVEWEPAESFLHTMRRAFDFANQLRLSTDCSIETSVNIAPLDEDRVEVRFILDLEERRRRSFRGSLIGGAILAASGATIGLVAVEPTLAILPMLGGAAAGAGVYGGARHGYRAELGRQSDTIARFLDHLEHERPSR